MATTTTSSALLFTTAPVVTPPGTGVAVAGSRPDDRLAMTVTGRNGVLKRWGPDEVDGEDVPMALRFGTAIPNGHQTLSSSLLRRIDLDYPDMELLGDVNVYGPGGEPVWQGRFTQFPREHGDSFAISPSATGYAAHLLDDPSFSEIYVDIDKTGWGGSSVQRKLNILTGGSDPNDPQTVADSSTGAPAVETSLTGAWARPAVVEAWYNSRQVPIGALYFAWKKDAGVGAGDTNWTWTANLSSDDVASSMDSSANLRAVGPASGTVIATTTSRKFALLFASYAIAAGADGQLYPIFWTALAVYGAHGIPRQGPVGDLVAAPGLYLSDIVANVVRRAAPLLNTDDVQVNTTIIPHYVADRVTASDALLALNNYAQWDWGVYDDRRFFFRPSDPDRLTWTVRLSEGCGLELEGEQSDDVFNGVLVTFTDTSGVSRAYGPPGAVADYTDASLQDTSPDNPANRAGIARKWLRLDVPTVTTPAGALIIGQAKLAEQRLPQRRGTVTVNSFARHPTAGFRPAWAIRAGDYVRIEDHPADVPRRIIGTDYDHQTRTNTLTVGNTSHKVDAILEWLQASQVALGGGS